jgi:WD40 repeat protein
MIAAACSHTHNDPVRNLAFSADSKWLFSGDDAGLLVLSSVPDGRRVAAWRCHDTSISALAVAPDFGLVVTASVDGHVRAWRVHEDRLDQMRLIAEVSFDGEVSGLAFRPPEYLWLAISVSSGEVALWQPYGTGEVHVTKVLPAQANSVAWTETGSRLAVGCDDCRIYQFEPGKDRSDVFHGHQHHVDQVAYSRCSKYLASGSHDRTVRVWEAETGLCVAVLPHLLDTVKSDWAKDGRLVTCSYDKRVRVWSPLASELIAEMKEHQYDVDDVAWSPNNRWIASCGWDHTVRVFDGDTYKQVAVIGGTRSQIYALAIDSRGRRFFAGTASGKVYEVSQSSDSQSLRILPGLHSGPVTSADVSPDGSILATVGADSILRLRPLSDTEPHLMIPSSHGLDLDIVRFSPDGKLLAVGARDNSLTCYEVCGTSLRTSYQILLERRVKALAWSATNSLLATAADGNVRLMNPEDGFTVDRWRAHNRMINSVAWSAESSLIATACWDRVVRVFAAKGQLVHELNGHSYNVNCVEFAPSGVIATAGWDGSIGFWDSLTGRLLRMVSVPGLSPVHALRWIPNTDRLLAGLWSGLVVLLQSDGSLVASWNLAESSQI